MEKNNQLLEILMKDTGPALGCTGPTCIAYVAAEAAEAVGGKIESIHIMVDSGIASKNADVGIPGTNSKGLRMAAAMGAICGDASAKLNVLHSATPETEELARKFVQSGAVTIEPDFSTDVLGLFLDCTVKSDRGTGRAVVVKTHTNLVYREANGEVQYSVPYDRYESMSEAHDAMASFGLKDFYDFAMECPIEKLDFLHEAIKLNTDLAVENLSGKAAGSGFGRSMLSRAEGSMMRKAKAMTAAGAETRMMGYPMAAYSCATSGNVGITASLPLISMAEDLKCSDEQLLRALALSYLTTICVKNRIGRVSSMCACVTAASQGIAAGAVYLLGGDFSAVQRAANNTVVNVFGVVCDGARLACALKLSSAAGMAIECAMMAMDGVETPADEGVVAENADATLNFLGSFAQTGMAGSNTALCRALYEKGVEREKREWDL